MAQVPQDWLNQDWLKLADAAPEMLRVLKAVQLAYWSGDAIEVNAHGWADYVQAIIMEVDPLWYDQFNAPFRSPATEGE